ncbi:MAG TPA: hypothetical protein VG204_06815 [Terriglobia bacterium]|nr:hypothetical protein [Terriglobia bacterium]
MLPFGRIEFERGALLLELLLVTLVLLATFYCPQLGSNWFRRIEQKLGTLARRRKTAVLVVGLLALAARAAVLPVLPIPKPFVHDEFGHLFVADTFLHGRLTNAVHPMAIHFETFYILQGPTYCSIFPVAQGIVLATGKILGGHFFVGVWLSIGIMCAAMCWMLQGWMPPGWALFGGILAVLHFGFFNYWSNSYLGGAAAATGGALLLGALPRVQRHRRVRDALILGLGLAILANSRPYEGFILSLPVALALLVWVAKQRGPALLKAVTRFVAPLTLLLAVTAGAMMYYFWRTTGNPLRMPYQVNEDRYTTARYFVFQSPKSEPAYDDPVIRDHYVNYQARAYRFVRQPQWWLIWSLVRIILVAMFYFGLMLTMPLVMLPRVLRDRRIRILLMAGAVSIAGLLGEVFYSPHYVAPMTCVFLAIAVQAMRHLRVYRREGQPTGLFLVRAIPILCGLSVLITLGVVMRHGRVPFLWADDRVFRGPLYRPRILAELEHRDGKQLVIIRYKPGHPPWDEWVYNAADIDAAKVVWARDQGTAKNRELLDYFKDRHVWLVEPDAKPPTLLPYPADAQ